MTAIAVRIMTMMLVTIRKAKPIAIERLLIEGSKIQYRRRNHSLKFFAVGSGQPKY
jgi:hypothetical protein